MKIQYRGHLLTGLALLAFAYGTPTLAQVQGEELETEEVVVTGTRIRDPNVISSSQIAVVGGADIEARGITRVEDFLNDLPQISPGQSITNSNGANGTATVNLRNLGCTRTLVLVNGRRMSPGVTSGGNCADLNAIPTLLLDRIEVLTGGASSVYGSDAVAGVVNFIMDDSFEGFKFKASHAFYQHKNDTHELRDLVESHSFQTADENIITGETDKFAFAFGGSINQGRGHVSGYAEKTNTRPILQGDYDISACALSGGTSRCGGSSTIPPGRWADFGGYRGLGLTNKDPSITGLDLKVLGDEFVPRAGQLYNYNPTNFFQRPDERLLTGLFARYSVHDRVEVYTELQAMQSESNAQIAYSGTFGNISSLPCYNALLSKQQYDTICGDWEGMGGDHAPDFASGAEALAYISALDIAVGDGDIKSYEAPLYSLKRNVEGDPRQSRTAFENFVQTVGVRGDITERWSFDAYYQISEIQYVEEYRNDLSVQSINRAVDVVSINGTPTCVSVLTGADGDCLPYNLFSGGQPGNGGIDGVRAGGAELQRYIANATFIRGDAKQTLASAYVSGELPFAFPSAFSGISVVGGFEQKEVSSDYRPDRPSRAGDRSGSGGASVPLSGSYDVNEYFLELGIPVTEGLSFDAGYRSSSYSTGIDTNTYKVGAFWRATRQIAVRGSYQAAIRHGTIGELFTPVGDGLTDLDNDPCGFDPENKAPPSATQEQCARTGLPAHLYGTDLKSPADQYNIRFGGNPEVEPEESTSYTAGLVLTPIDDLTITLDYFSILVEGGISSVSANTSLTKCIETGQAAFCDQIHRNPTNGSLWLSGGWISRQTTNLSEEETTGIDVIFSYTADTSGGTLVFEGITTYLLQWDVTELPGEEPIECGGNWGGSCGKNPLPELSGNYKITWASQYNLDVALGIRFLGATTDLNALQIDFDAVTYFDLTATYHTTNNIRTTGGVSNLFDRDPIVTSNAGTAPGNGNTFPAYFDALGRYVYVNLELQF